MNKIEEAIGIIKNNETNIKQSRDRIVHLKDAISTEERTLDLYMDIKVQAIDGALSFKFATDCTGLYKVYLSAKMFNFGVFESPMLKSFLERDLVANLVVAGCIKEHKGWFCEDSSILTLDEDDYKHLMENMDYNPETGASYNPKDILVSDFIKSNIITQYSLTDECIEFLDSLTK